VFNSVSASSLVENSWTPKAPMQQARNSLGVIAVDGKIYAIGGYTVNDKIVGINMNNMILKLTLGSL
jgi:hypothetical protein